MKKSFIFLGTLLVSGLSFAQVGVNTETPQATLDVVGKPTDTSSLDGVIAPRITGAQLRAKTYTGSQEGALVYVTTADPAPAGQTVNVINIGYYYFDGTLWQTVKPSASTNIYNANGSLTSTRTLTLGGFQLNFNGTERSTYWDTAGRIHQRTTNAASDAAMGFHGGSANLWIQQWYNGSAAITASQTSTSLDLATHYTTAPAPITLSTSVGGNTSSIERMRITGEGNVGINTIDPTEKFDNDGITRLRNLPLNGATNAINTTSTGDPSSAQDQTFTATKTVVADDNGVLGYVNGLPTSTALGSWYNTATNTVATANTQNIYQMGKVGVMTNSPTGLFHAYNNSSTANPFTVESDNAGSTLGNDTYFYGYGTSLTPGLFFLSARGTKASPTVVQNGDLLGEYNFGAYLDSGWNYSLTSVRGVYNGNGTTTDTSLAFVTASQTRMTIDTSGNLGLGANTPKAKVHVQSGDVYVEQIGSGIIMKSPNGNCWRVTVSNTGTFTSAGITCP